jgi:hypothetical protein
VLPSCGLGVLWMEIRVAVWLGFVVVCGVLWMRNRVEVWPSCGTVWCAVDVEYSSGVGLAVGGCVACCGCRVE